MNTKQLLACLGDNTELEIEQELLRRRKSKKARRRLMRSMLKRRSMDGVFARKVHWWNFMKACSAPIKQIINYEGLARKIFTVKEIS